MLFLLLEGCNWGALFPPFYGAANGQRPAPSKGFCLCRLSALALSESRLLTSDSLSKAELSLPPRGVVSFPSCGEKLAPSRSPLRQSICLGFPHTKFSVFVYIVHMICRSAWVDESAVRSPILRVWVSGGRIGRVD